MKNITLLFTAFLLLSSISVFAQTVSVGNKISFQGRLEQNGKLANGQFSMEFFIRTWSERQDVTVRNGIYTVTLGSIKPIPSEIFEENTTLNLLIYVAGQKLEPIIPIIPVPFSYKALTVEKNAIGKEQIREKSVESKHLADNTISAGMIKEAIIGTYHIENKSIETQDIKPNTQNGFLYTNPNQEVIWLDFATASLMFSSVSQPPLEMGKVWIGSPNKVATAQSVLGDVSMSLLGFTSINASTITNSKLAANAVTTDKIQDFTIITNDFATASAGQVLTTNNIGQVLWQTQNIFATTTGVGTDKVLTTNPLGNVVWENKSAFVSSGGGNFVNVNGTVPMTGNWNVGSFGLNNVAFISVIGQSSFNGNLAAFGTIQANNGVSLAYTNNLGNGMLRFNTAGHFEGYAGGIWNPFVTSGAFSSAILQNGNTFSTAMKIGTLDNFPLAIATNSTVAMFIDNTGKVGISTTNPQSELHVDKITGNTNIRLTGGTLQNQGIQAGLAGQGYFVGRRGLLGNNEFSIHYENIYGVPNQEILVYNPVNQLLGIGKNNPSFAKLDVNGNAYISGFLTVNSGIGLGYDAGGSNGMLRFNTAGYFEGYAGGIWNPFVTTTVSGGSIFQGGNTFSTAMNIGTNDAQRLLFKANNQLAGRIDITIGASNGNAFYGYQAGNDNTTGEENTFLGYLSGKGNQSGKYNTFLGYQTGLSNVIGDHNTFVGFGAGNNNNGGNYNTFMGNLAGQLNNTGSENTFVGYQVGLQNLTGTQNTYMGFGSGNNATGSYNTFLGYGTGFSNTGNSNVFVGYNAGRSETGSNKLYIANSNTSTPLIFGDFANSFASVNGNLAIGYANFPATFGDGMLAFNTGSFYGYSGGNWNKFATVSASSSILQGGNSFATAVVIGSNDAQRLLFRANNQLSGRIDVTTGTGNENTFYGYRTGIANTTGFKNLFSGYQAGQANLTGNDNVFSGHHAGFANLSGGNNVFLGSGAGGNNTSGSHNLLLGSASGFSNLAGNNNILLGTGSGNNFQNISNSVMVGYQAGATNLINATGTGNVFLGYEAGGNETGSNKLYIENSNSSTPLIYGDFATDFISINGTFAIGNSAAAPFGGMMKFQNNKFSGYSGGVWNDFVTVNASGGSILQGGNSFATAVEIGTLNNAPIFFKTNGQYAGRIAPTIGGNNFIGLNAGRYNAGINNTALGAETFYNSTAGSYNVAIGDQALYSNLANGNVGVGVNSLQNNQTGSNNTVMGYQAMMLGNAGAASNVAIGFQAGLNTAAGGNNVYVGNRAGASSTDQFRNTYIGNQAGENTGLFADNAFIGNEAGKGTQSSSNVAIGSYAAISNNSGGAFVAIGFQAGKNYSILGNSVIIGTNAAAGNGTTAAANDNVIIGNEAGFKNANASNNTFIGRGAGHENASSSNNTFLGYNAGYNNTAAGNTFVGYNAGSGNVAGSDNVFIGQNAGEANAGANRQVAIGTAAGSKNTAGSNIFIGWWAGESNTTGSSSVAIGNEAGRFNIGTNNVFIGHGAGRVFDGLPTLFAGSGNVFIGDNVGNNDPALRGVSNTLAIDNSDTATPLIFGNFNTNNVTINGSFAVTGNITTNIISAGSLITNGAGVIQASDRRLKENIVGLNAVLPRLMQLGGYRYNLIGQKETEIGVIAQEIEAQFPEITAKIEKDGKEYLGVKYDRLTAVLIESIKEQQAQIEALKAKNSLLEKQSTEKTAALEAKLDKLQIQMQLLLEQLTKTNSESGKK